jgi:two-component system, OmpR family, sensor histidine kinase VicK
MEVSEVRHLTGSRSNFGIVDRKECLLHSISHEDQPLSHAIITNANALVEAQQFLFETLWNKAIPAQEKIREIEEGITPPFTETLRDPHEIRKLAIELITSAKQEILMLLFPNTTTGNIFLRGGEKGNAQQTIAQSLNEAVRQNGIRVRILTYKDIQKQIEKIIATQQKIITGRRVRRNKKVEGY